MTLQELKTNLQNIKCVQVCGYSHYLHLVSVLNMLLLAKNCLNFFIWKVGTTMH